MGAFSGPALISSVVCNVGAWQSSIWLSARRQPAHQSAAPKCHIPSPWRASCPAAVSTTPSVRQGRLGHRQVGMRPRAVVHVLAFSIGWRRTWASARIKCQTSSPPGVGLQAHVHQAEYLHITQREFKHAKVKHPAAKQVLLVLTGCSFSPQPNLAFNRDVHAAHGRPLTLPLGSHKVASSYASLRFINLRNSVNANGILSRRTGRIQVHPKRASSLSSVPVSPWHRKASANFRRSN